MHEGMRLDGMHMFDFGLQTTLRVSAAEHPPRVVILLPYRLLCATFAVGASAPLVVTRGQGGRIDTNGSVQVASRTEN